MTTLRHQLLAALQGIDGLRAEPSRVAGGVALWWGGKEIAHFHNDHEIDLRLTRPVIRRLGLVHPERSAQHPTRSVSSQWIELRFHDAQDVARVAALVRLATEQVEPRGG